MKQLLLITLFAFSAATNAQTCIQVAGLSFEVVQGSMLLASSQGKNIAFVKVCGSLPKTIGNFRFFSSVLCSCGAEDKFQIDGQMMTVCVIERFK